MGWGEPGWGGCRRGASFTQHCFFLRCHFYQSFQTFVELVFSCSPPEQDVHHSRTLALLPFARGDTLLPFTAAASSVLSPPTFSVSAESFSPSYRTVCQNRLSETCSVKGPWTTNFLSPD